MIFMGEEYGETAPFQYFTSHADRDLIEAVRKGRLEEFDDFRWEGEPPDPHSEATFERSKLDWSLAGRDGHAELRGLYRELFALRRSRLALRTLDLAAVDARPDDSRRTLLVRRWSGADQVLVAFNFGDAGQTVECPFPGSWTPLLDTGATIAGSVLSLPPFGFGVWGF